jgi:hypothetical protein
MALDDVCKELKLDGHANAKETIAFPSSSTMRRNATSMTRRELSTLIPVQHPSYSSAGVNHW